MSQKRSEFVRTSAEKDSRDSTPSDEIAKTENRQADSKRLYREAIEALNRASDREIDGLLAGIYNG